MNGLIYFSARDSSHGPELWRSDGTEAGTSLVKDINAGNNSSDLGWLTNLNGSLYFNAYEGVHGRELWRSDGTEAGTIMVKDINPRPATSSLHHYYDKLILLAGRLYFVADDGQHGRELWQSNGFATSTVLVQDLRPGISSAFTVFPENPAATQGRLFFSADNGQVGLELWAMEAASQAPPTTIYLPIIRKSN
jgi:ELWxxDGT repeat protein